LESQAAQSSNGDQSGSEPGLAGLRIALEIRKSRTYTSHRPKFVIERRVSSMGGSVFARTTAALALLFLGTTAALAATVPVSLEFEVTSVDPAVTEVAVGDRFTLDFVIEDSTTDTASGVGSGQFPGLLTSFDVTADPSNTGAWTPSGTYSSAASNFVTNAFGDNLTLQVRGTGYPDGGAGLTFRDFDLSFSWPPGINDSGSGDTFAEQLGGTFDIPPAVLRAASIRFTDGLDFPAAELERVRDPVPVTTLDRPALILLSLLLAAVAATVLIRRA
jgi:hypothetical protein